MEAISKQGLHSKAGRKLLPLQLWQFSDYMKTFGVQVCFMHLKISETNRRYENKTVC